MRNLSVKICRENQNTLFMLKYKVADKSLGRPGRKQATATEDFEDILFIIIIGGILVLFIYRVSQEERTKLRERVPYVKLYRYNPKHLYPKLND